MFFKLVVDDVDNDYKNNNNNNNNNNLAINFVKHFLHALNGTINTSFPNFLQMILKSCQYIYSRPIPCFPVGFGFPRFLFPVYIQLKTCLLVFKIQLFYGYSQSSHSNRCKIISP